MQSPIVKGAMICGRSSPSAFPSAFWLLSLVGLLLLTLAACGNSVAQPSPTHTPHLAAGQTAIFASFANATQVGTPTQGTQPGRLIALQSSDGALVWSASTSGPAFPVMFSNGTLFTAIVTSTNNAPPNSSVEAVRASDGKRLWQSASGSLASPIAADTNAVYVLAQNLSTQQAQVQALRAGDGQAMWTTTLSSVSGVTKGGPAIGAGAGLLDQGTLYLVTLGQSSNGVGPSSTVTAIRASDGTMLWSVALPGDFVTPQVGNGTLYLSGTTFASGSTTAPVLTPTVVALRAADGTQIWAHPLANQGTAAGPSPLAITDTAVFVAAAVQSQAAPGPGGAPSFTTSLVALKPATGAELWRVPTAGITLTLATDNTSLYLAPMTGGTGFSGAVASYRQSDGKQLWSQPQDNVAITSIVAVSNGHLVALGVSGASSQQVTGDVEAFSTADGTTQWKYSLPNAGPVAAVLGAG